MEFKEKLAQLVVSHLAEDGIRFVAGDVRNMLVELLAGCDDLELLEDIIEGFGEEVRNNHSKLHDKAA